MTSSSPMGCALCGINRRGHGRQYTETAGWHAWQQPTQQQIKDRMYARRAARQAAAPTQYHARTAWMADNTGEDGIPYCADCGTEGCRQWMRTDTRLTKRRMELAGINPKRRSGAGWGGVESRPF
ncbi:hypothetical protein [Streptomyces fradiae]|nr:hypothetical protein [Streptomyces fradiae]